MRVRFPCATRLVIGCQYEWEARRILAELKERLKKFGLEVSEEKTRIVEFGRFAQECAEKRGKKAGTVEFLGFTHFCAKGRNGLFVVGRRTSGKKFRKALKAITGWLKRIRNRMPLADWWRILGWKLQGHYQYYGITGNGRRLYQFYQRVLWVAYTWWNRRSQKRSGSRIAFMKMLWRHRLPLPRITHSFRLARA